jgi:membrane-associated phospholipid phosphatase
MDRTLFDEVNRFAVDTPWLHSVLFAYATYGVILFGGLLVLNWWLARVEGRGDRAALAIAAGLATLLAVAVNQPIVDAVHKARPYTLEPNILVLAQRTADFSSPSDHAVMAGAAVAGLFFVSLRLGALGAIAAVLMAFSRVYIAAHYPSDVALGLLVGAAIATVALMVVRRPLTRLSAAVERTAARPVLTAQSAVSPC